MGGYLLLSSGIEENRPRSGQNCLDQRYRKRFFEALWRLIPRKRQIRILSRGYECLVGNFAAVRVRLLIRISKRTMKEADEIVLEE